MAQRFDLLTLLGRGRGRRGMPADDTAAQSVRTVENVDTALVIEAARHVVTTRIATQASLERHLFVGPEAAAALLARLEHCEVIGPEQDGRRRRVLATAGELPELVAEFQRRG
jgi:hypothetical protein